MNHLMKSLLLAGVCALGLGACTTTGTSHVRGGAVYHHGSTSSGVYVSPSYRYRPYHYSSPYRYRYSQPYYTNPHWRLQQDRRMQERRWREQRWRHHRSQPTRPNRPVTPVRPNRPVTPVRPTPVRPSPPARERHQRAQPNRQIE